METKNPEFNKIIDEALPIVRKVKPRPTHLQGVVTVGLKTVNLDIIREKKVANEKKYIKNLEKMSMGFDKYRKLIVVFSQKYELLTGKKFTFQKKRVRTSDYGGKLSGKIIQSDGKRLVKVFKNMEEVSKDIKILSRLLEMMMDSWSEWDKANAINLIGFLERQCVGDDVNMFYMKMKKKNSSKDVILNEDKRVDNNEKHRKYFDKVS